MTKRPTLFSLILSMPLLLWQLLFFLFPLLFLVAISFWTVRNFQMTPDLNFGNWERVLSRGVFWDAYFRTMVLGSRGHQHYRFSGVLCDFIQDE